MGKSVVVILQARLRSSRLPKKVLKEVNGRALLSYQIERLKRTESVGRIITAVPKEDRELIAFCENEKVDLFCGSEEDVLSRYYDAAKAYQADVVIRITGDCPLIDPDIIEKALVHFEGCDYVSNCLERTYPRGMDVEVMTFEALKKAADEAEKPYEREHVTPYIVLHPRKFRLKNFTYSKDYSSIRLTVDTKEDFELVEKVIETLYPQDPVFSLEDILTLLEKDPSLLEINQHVKQKRAE